MVRELRYAFLCLLLAFAHTVAAGGGAPGTPTRPAPATPPAAVPEPPVSGPEISPPPQATPPPPAAPPPARTPPSPATPEGPAEVPAEQAAATEENPDWAVTLQRIATSVVSIDVDQTRA